MPYKNNRGLGVTPWCQIIAEASGINKNTIYQLAKEIRIAVHIR